MSWKRLDKEELYKIHEYYDDTRFWKPQTGDTLEGMVFNLKKGKYHKYFMIIEDENGNKWRIVQCNSIHELINRLGIIEGDMICLTYEGSGDYDKKIHHYILRK